MALRQRQFGLIFAPQGGCRNSARRFHAGNSESVVGSRWSVVRGEFEVR
jgi:hypothetical protein